MAVLTAPCRLIRQVIIVLVAALRRAWRGAAWAVTRAVRLLAIALESHPLLLLLLLLVLLRWMEG